MLLKFIYGAYVTLCDHGLTAVCVSRAFLNGRIDFESIGENFLFRCTSCHLDVSRKVQKACQCMFLAITLFYLKIHFKFETSGPAWA